MPIDSSIPLGVKQPDTMSTLGGMLNVASGAQNLKNSQQAYEAGKVSLESNKAILQERNNVRSLFQDPANIMDAEGNIDFNKAGPKIMEAAPTQGGQILTSLITAQRDSVAAKQSLLSLNENQRAATGQFVMSLAQDSPETAFKKMEELKKVNPQLTPALDYARKHFLEPASSNPEAFKTAVLKVGQAAMAPSTQAGVIAPSGPVLNNGQQQQQFNTNPMAGPAGPVAGVGVQNQLPPTTPTFDQNTNAPGYLGAQGPVNGQFQGDPKEISAQIAQIPDVNARAQAFAAHYQQLVNGGRVQSGPALGVEKNISGTVDVLNKDFDETTAQAKNAGQDIGVLQNIKKYAKGAATGVTSDKRAFVSGLAGLLGMDAGEMAKTNTDLLAKNSNMLALVGGNTDAARALAEGANPNSKMTSEAIEAAADQVIGQRKSILAKQKLLSPLKSNPEAYQKTLTEFTQASDPRIFQLEEMPLSEQIKMKTAMSTTEQKEFREKIRKLRALGVLN